MTMKTTIIRPADPALTAALKLSALFALLKLALTFALTLYTQHLGYSYFRDEFYYIACGRHLAWGYVDHGPIVAVQARLGELLFGDSLFGIRVLSAVAGAVMVFLGGLLCWVLGGRRSAQSLAMLGLIVVPQYIGVDGFLSMNSCEPMFWSACLLAVLMIARGSSALKWWVLFGLSAGIGLLNKPLDGLLSYRARSRPARHAATPPAVHTLCRPGHCPACADRASERVVADP